MTHRPKDGGSFDPISNCRQWVIIIVVGQQEDQTRASSTWMHRK